MTHYTLARVLSAGNADGVTTVARIVLDDDDTAEDPTSSFPITGPVVVIYRRYDDGEVTAHLRPRIV